MVGRRISDEQLIEIIEAAIFVADKPVSKRHLKDTVLNDLAISMARINDAVEAIQVLRLRPFLQSPGLARHAVCARTRTSLLDDDSN